MTSHGRQRLGDFGPCDSSRTLRKASPLTRKARKSWSGRDAQNPLPLARAQLPQTSGSNGRIFPNPKSETILSSGFRAFNFVSDFEFLGVSLENLRLHKTILIAGQIRATTLELKESLDLSPKSLDGVPRPRGGMVDTRDLKSLGA